MRNLKSVFILTMVLFVLVSLAGVVSAQEFSVGMTVQDLGNQIWASTATELEELVEEDGGEFTAVDCKSNAPEQVSQIENFISSGVDVIIVHPAEKNAVEEPLKRAREEGIKVYSWDEKLENSDMNWIIDNYELGEMIGEHASEWINEKLDGETQVGVLNYPQIGILKERGDGIVDAIKEHAPDADIVAESSAINSTEGIEKTETFLQQYPDMKVIAAIGGGGAVGANEAVKANNKLSDDFGIFAADATDQELEAMTNNEANRMSVLITGDAEKMADVIYGYVQKMLNDEEIEQNVYRELIPVTQENVDKYYDDQE
ncbi:MAG: sugar ABC transporter substrate-binding protein [Bacillota bacterium]